MRIHATALAAALVTLAACGAKKSGNGEAGATGSEPTQGPLEPGAPIDSAIPPCSTPTAGSNISVHSIGTVSGSSTLATSPPNDTRLFVIEQSGRIRIFVNEQLTTAPFLDITTSDIVTTNDEQGLLGLAFDPNYATNGFFYVDYTATNPNAGSAGEQPFLDKVVRYKVSASNPNAADPTTATVILAVEDPFVNHNGGMIEFGADGYLYISIGDGGSGGDPERNGQNPNALLAKIMRIDPNHPANGKPYGIPADNPYATGGGAPEVFILGVRNPWRWSFDRATGDMWIGDVGQGETEELDVLLAGHQAGQNLGWSAYEGSGCCATQDDKCTQTGSQQACDPTGKFFPQLTHSHNPDGWLAIIGGQVYRGTCYPDIVGTYFFTDNSKHGLSEAKLQPDGSIVATDLPGTWPSSPASIHADSRGELYETTTSGEIFHIMAGP